MSARVKARARVQVTLDIAVPDIWDSAGPLEQIWKQARESARGMLAKGLGPGPLPIVGEPKVTTVLVEVDDR